MTIQRLTLPALLLLAACTHGAPLDYSASLEDQPFDPTAPVRLTYSRSGDSYPVWLPGGSMIGYSYAAPPSGSGDICVGTLPGGGGQVTRTSCVGRDAADDSTDAMIRLAPRTMTDAAWIEYHSLRTRLLPDRSALMVGDPHHTGLATRLVAMPGRSVSGRVHYTATDIRWLSRTQLAYIGTDLALVSSCGSCALDTVQIFQEVMLVDRDGANLRVLPGSEQYSSIWPTEDSTGIYFTRAGQTSVWRRSLTSTTTELVRTFPGIARSISVAAGRLSVVVGGNVFYVNDPFIGTYQSDDGGQVTTMELATGVTQLHPVDSARVVRAVLAPDGRRMVAEGVDQGRGDADLWLLAVE